ncbi:MAG: hypothetical protein ACYTAN_08245 [Planctomycetota bacterium]|jgi:hypothetical protein
MSEIIVDVEGRVLVRNLSGELMSALESLVKADPLTRDRYEKMLEYNERKGTDGAE